MQGAVKEYVRGSLQVGLFSDGSVLILCDGKIIELSVSDAVEVAKLLQGRNPTNKEIREAHQKCNRDEVTLLEFFQQVDGILNQEPAKQ